MRFDATNPQIETNRRAGLNVSLGTASSLDPAWRGAICTLVVGLGAILAFYWQVTIAAVDVWYSSTTYNHCFLIPFVTAYLLWEKRAVIASLHPRPTLWPLLLLLAIGGVTLLGNLMSIMEIQHFALVATILAFTLCVVGWAAFSVVLFPLLYLFFMVPSGEFLVPKLQDFTARFVVLGLQSVGIPVYSDGIFIKIPNGVFEVAEACAGIRFLIASVAFGFLFSYLVYSSWRKRAVFIVLSAIIPIVANGLRAFGIVLIAHATDGRVAAGVDHIVYGWGFFVVILFGMMWVGLAFRDATASTPKKGRDQLSTMATRAPIFVPFVGGLALYVAAAAPIYGYWLDHRQPEQRLTLMAPNPTGAWHIDDGTSDHWRPTFAGADGELLQTYAGPNGSVQLYIAYFASQRYGAKIISAQNRLEDEEGWRRASTSAALATIDGDRMSIAKQVLVAGQAHKVAWYFYWVDGQLTASPMRAKLLGARGTLTGTREAAAIVIAADVVGTEEDAEHRIQDFLTNLEPAPFLRQIVSR